VSSPVVATRVRAEYTRGAREARIQGEFTLEGIVQTDGTVESIKVRRSLDTLHGLDDQAINALRQWTFKPGTKDGKPVAVLLTFHFGFYLDSVKQ
jgi:TonB family protein